MSRPRIQALLPPLFRWGILVTLFVAPTQWSVQPCAKLHLSLADVTLALTAGVWALDRLLSQNWPRPRLPPWPHLLFAAAAACSAFTAPDRGSAIRDLIQYVEYFLAGSLLFGSFLRTDIRRPLWVLGGATALILGLALVQYLGDDGNPLKVCGSFGNRNVLGGYLALVLPLAFAGLLGLRNWVLKAAMALLLLAGFTVNLSGASYLAVAGVIAGMAAARGPRLFIPVAAGILLWQAQALPNLPRANDLVHFRSLALYDADGTVNRRYPDWQGAYSMALTHPWLGVGLGNYQKHVGQYYDNIPRQTGPAEPDIQNLYLVLAASAGLPSLAAFLALLATAVGRACKQACAPGPRATLALGLAGSLCAFGITSVWHPLLVRGIGIPLVFLLALSSQLSLPETVHGPRDDI